MWANSGTPAEGNIDEIVDSIIREIKRFMDSYYYSYDMWYVGVSADPGRQLAEGHGVDPKLGQCIHRPAPTTDVARMVGMHFIEILGSDGSLENGSDGARHVYAYKKHKYTRP